MADFNAALDRLSEHHDLPRVSAGVRMQRRARADAIVGCRLGRANEAVVDKGEREAVCILSGGAMLKDCDGSLCLGATSVPP